MRNLNKNERNQGNKLGKIEEDKPIKVGLVTAIIAFIIIAIVITVFIVVMINKEQESKDEDYGYLEHVYTPEEEALLEYDEEYWNIVEKEEEYVEGEVVQEYEYNMDDEIIDDVEDF